MAMEHFVSIINVECRVLLGYTYLRRSALLSSITSLSRYASGVCIHCDGAMYFPGVSRPTCMLAGCL